MQAHSLGLQGPPQPLLTPVRVGADVGRHVHLVGVRLCGDLAHLVDEVTVAHDQAAAPLAQTGVEIAQTVREERQPVRHGEPGRVHGPVPHEQRDDLLGAVEGRGERRMVVQAQVAGEQDDRDAHDTYSGEWGGSA